MSVGADLQAVREMWQAFRIVQPDIVHTHTPKPGVYGRPTARLAGVPIIVNTVHGVYATHDGALRRHLVVYGLERIAAAFSHAELVQNAEDFETLAHLGVSRSELHLLGNGIDFDRFSQTAVPQKQVRAVREEVGARTSDIVVGAVGRLVWEKGFRETFAAAARLRANLPNVRFAMVGPDDDDKADAIGPIDRCLAEIEGGIRFLGMRFDMESLYAAFDLFVLASWREGFSRLGMEAAAMGLPIVATDVRGCREVVHHGITGMLVPP